MTQEWIDSFHRKTMNFIGGFEIYNDFEGKERYIEIETDMTFLLEEMDWFDDWNWIMQVCIKLGMESVTTDKEQLILEINEKLEREK